MNKKELKFWLDEGLDTHDLLNLCKTEIEVGKFYRWFYPDGRMFAFKCTEIWEGGDCFGDGFVDYELSVGGIFCNTEDFVLEVSKNEYESLLKSPLESIAYENLSPNWILKFSDKEKNKFVLENKNYSKLKIDIHKKKKFDRVLIYTSDANDEDIEHIILSGVVEDQFQLVDIMESMDVESQIDVGCI
jgi:hypothetical protein